MRLIFVVMGAAALMLCSPLIVHAKDAVPVPKPPAPLNCGLPRPDPGCFNGAGGDASSPDVLDTILGSTVKDLNIAIDKAGQTPVLAAEVACFTRLRDDLGPLSEAEKPGAGLFTAYIDLVRLHAAIADLQTDPCLTVCGRATQIVRLPSGVIGKLALHVPNICELGSIVTQ